MRRAISAVGIFGAGLLLGILVTQPGTAQADRIEGLRLNHVGIFVKDLNESLNFYTKVMGFQEAFSFKDKNGNPTTVYLQINHDTFLELAPASPERPAGLSHMGIWADDLNATVAALRQRGVKVDDPRVGASKAPLTNVMDPNGVRVELLEYGPESLQRKAMESWK
jgi:catechol 2,3-dioxygenase-like lactoylglutathione lyase family enzyme